MSRGGEKLKGFLMTARLQDDRRGFTGTHTAMKS